MILTAKVNGKVVSYDTLATFIVEGRRGNKFCTVTSHGDFSRAVEKFHRVSRQRTAKLSQALNGRVTKLVVARG